MQSLSEIISACRKSVIENYGSDLRKPCDQDYIGANGLLYCHKCRTPMQSRVNFPEYGEKIVRTACACEKEAEKEAVRQIEHEQEQKRIKELRQISMMDKRFESSCFESFKVTDDNRRQLTVCKRYVERFDTMLEKNQGLLLWGDTGTGKTFAAACIANALLEKSYSVLMTSLIRIIEKYHDGISLSSDYAMYSRMNAAKLLIFDDFGAERDTEYAAERVYSIIDSRYRDGKPVVLTTNLSLQEMMYPDDIRRKRIYERVMETCYPVEFTGPSWRDKAAADRFDEMSELFK